MRSRERAESVIVIFSPSSVPWVLDIIGFFLNLSCSGIDGGRRSVLMRRGSSCSRPCSLM